METLRKEALESELMQFIGTEHWYKHPLMPAMTYTDGVKYFAEQTESYWLLDVGCYCDRVLPNAKGPAIFIYYGGVSK